MTWLALSLSLTILITLGCVTTCRSDDQVDFDPVDDMFSDFLAPALDPLGSLLGLTSQPLANNLTSLEHLLNFALTQNLNSISSSTPLHNLKDGSKCTVIKGGVLADGHGIKTGQLCDRSGLLWQSSGQLRHGCPKHVEIQDCYSLSLTSNPQKQLDPGGATPRQRIELLTPGYGEGTSMVFTWKSHLFESITTSNHFFHLFQLYTRPTRLPILTLDAKHDRVAIFDPLRCSSGCGNGTWLPLSDYVGKTMLQVMKVTFGLEGSVEYVMADLQTGTIQMAYSAQGPLGQRSTSLKFGTYRAVVPEMSSSTYIFSLTNLASGTSNVTSPL